MFGAILNATNSSFQKSMTFCRSIYVKKVMKLLAFIFEQPSYRQSPPLNAHADVSSGARSLNFGVSLHLHANFVYMSSEGSGAESGLLERGSDV